MLKELLETQYYGKEGYTLMEDSIIKTVRTALGLNAEDTSFDSELFLHINSTLATLNQNGIGLQTSVSDDTTEWNDFKDPSQLEGNKNFEQVKLYVFLKTKIVFDPPPPSNIHYFNEIIIETLWRLRELYKENEVIIIDDTEY